MRVNGVFEGGGVRGIGLVGAANIMESSGLTFSEVAGTSAGAIVAALLAAGYTSNELKKIVLETEYNNFKQASFLDKLGLPGKVLSILMNYGIYSADYFENWMSDLLAAKNIHVFGDLKNNGDSYRKYKLTVMASDITSHRIVVLPDDLVKYGIDAENFSVARAVRMSMSIPIFFEPVKFYDRSGREHIIVDGGLLSNFPMWVFDDKNVINADSKRPLIGLKFKDSPRSSHERKTDIKPISNFIDYVRYIADTMMDWRDNQFVRNFRELDSENPDMGGIISISPTIFTEKGTKDINATYFDITQEEAELLFINGQIAAREALPTL